MLGLGAKISFAKINVVENEKATVETVEQDC